MAFSITSGHFKYCMMPYGLSCRPLVFQCLVNGILQDMLDKFMIAYIDDILIYSPSLETHMDHVKWALKRLLQNQLYVKGVKCEFHQSKISFLGYVFSTKEVPMEVNKVTAVREQPILFTVKDLQRFLSFVNF